MQVVLVGGQSEREVTAARVVMEKAKHKPRSELGSASEKYAGLMQVDYRRISIRDQRSRWGSCSAGGDLSYSWRLILTPAYVLDYVPPMRWPISSI